ncbi:MAG TPA: hypothetical protein VFF64_22560 [Candidatus Eremiobacteraceae bacterium]|nr:hypothetical protein [Candidatus Eremiobacteraceae bacterium]
MAKANAPRGGRSWRYYVIAPLVLVSVGPIVLAYKLIVGWWLNPIVDRRYEQKFREQVRTDLAFLFHDFDGQLVPNERPDKYATLVTVEASELRVVVSQHHGDYGISVARRDSPEVKESLESVLEAIYERDGTRRKPRYISLTELGELFREKFTEVQMALSKENYADTAAAIDRSHQMGMQRMARDFNRPNGFFDADLINPNDLKKKVPE